jgi:hypothetical protein
MLSGIVYWVILGLLLCSIIRYSLYIYRSVYNIKNYTNHIEYNYDTAFKNYTSAKEALNKAKYHRNKMTIAKKVFLPTCLSIIIINSISIIAICYLITLL